MCKLFQRKQKTTDVLCAKSNYMVPYCQWRSGAYCASEECRYRCAGVWEQGVDDIVHRQRRRFYGEQGR